MKTIKTLLAVLFVGSVFIACENDNVNDELSADEIENVDTFSVEEDDEDIQPGRGN